MDTQRIRDRIMARVEKRDGPLPTQCWLWPVGSICGYGSTSVDGKKWLVHRLMWTCDNGAIPAGLNVCHKCDVRTCCNPSHLSLGTQAQNIRDALSRGRMCSGDRSIFRTRPELFRGSRNHNSKLNGTQARIILAVKRLGNPKRGCYALLAEAFGVHPVSVCQVVTGRTWKHV